MKEFVQENGSVITLPDALATGVREGKTLVVDGEPVKGELEGVDYSGLELRALASKPYLGPDFWLQFPIEIRPLKFVPGRNRREKRTFRALAAKQERGTITRGRKGKGGELGKLNALFAELARAGVVRMTGEKK